MTAMDWPRFTDFLRTKLPPIDSVDFAALAQLTAAASKQAQLLNTWDETIASLSIPELLMLAVSQDQPSAPVIKALFLATLIDGDISVCHRGIACGIAPQWPWIKPAASFDGSLSDLTTLLLDAGDSQARSAAVVLATSQPRHATLVRPELLMMFLVEHSAKAFHTLLWRALAGPYAQEVARWALRTLPNHLEVLYASQDVDALLSTLVEKAQSDDPQAALGTLARCGGDLTRMAMIIHLSACGRRDEALALARGVRELDPGYLRAQTLIQTGEG